MSGIMVLRHKRKITKKRGMRTPGTGNTKNKRGKGSRMGNPHKKSKGGGSRNFLHLVKYMPEKLHKRGFKRPNRKKYKAINLSELEKMGETEIKLLALGYHKVLGKGKITKPLKIKALMFSKTAKDKIEKAGGQAIEIGGNK